MAYIAVKGMPDLYYEKASAYDYITNIFKAVAELYGYHPFSTPVLEYTNVFDRATGESSDVVRKEMYTFLDKGDRSVTMRPEFTAGVARCIVENKLYATKDLPIKAYYAGPVFRYERPQQGRYRQFIQAGIECVGLDSARADAECIIMAVQFLSMLGFSDIKVKLNTLGDSASRENYKKALRDYFSSKIECMCGDCKSRLELNPMRILDCKVKEDQEIAKDAPKMSDYISMESEKRFYSTLSILSDFEIEYEVDPSLVRGLDYYGEVVFEVHATSNTGADYGALLGGGHYDGMLVNFGGPEMAGVGFAVGVDRIYSIMNDNGMLETLKDSLDAYVMPVGEDVLDEAFRLTTYIRTLGYSAETPMEALKMGKMFKKATARNAKYAIILGADELAQGIVQVKNLATQEQNSVAIDDLPSFLDGSFGEKEEHHCCHDGEGCECEDNEEGCCCHGNGGCHHE